MSEVSDLIDAATTYASNAETAAINALNGASAALNNLGRTISTDPMKGLVIAVSPPAVGDPGDVPAYTGSHMTPDDLATLVGDPPELSSVLELILPPDVVDTGTDLVYVDPPYPTGVNPDYTLLADVPVLDDLPPIPTSPDLQSEIAGIIAPTLIDIDVPDAPTYVAPEFTGVKPTFDATAPTDLDLALRDAYNTAAPTFMAAVSDRFDAFLSTNFPEFAAGMAKIEARLNTYLDGGSALSPAVEDAMQGRARNRADAEYRRAAAKAAKDAARMGHTVIGPMLASQMLDIDQTRRDANIKVAIEIFVENAKLEQSNLQFAVTQSTNLRKIAIDASLQYLQSIVQVNGQALDYARASVDAVVKAFDVAARYAETQARIYEADANVYRALLEGAMQQIRAYEATINGLRAKADLNRVQIEAYTARLNAVRIEADVYRAGVEAVVAAAGLQRERVALYDAKVKAFSSQVNAFTSQYSAYEAAVRGQEARMNVNVSRAREFEARTNAYAATVSAKAKAIDSQIQTNNQKVNAFKVKVDAYAALERSKVDSVNIDVQQYKAQLDAFVAKANAISAKSRAESANYEVALRGVIAQANVILEQIKEFNHLDIVRATGLAQVSQTLGAQFAHLAEAAMSGMNSLAADISTTSA